MMARIYGFLLSTNDSQTSTIGVGVYHMMSETMRFGLLVKGTWVMKALSLDLG